MQITLQSFDKCDRLAVDIETEPVKQFDVPEFGMMPENGKILGIGIYHPDIGGYYSQENEFEDLKKLFKGKSLIFHNAKFDVKWLNYYGFNIGDNIDDTMLMLDLILAPMKRGLKAASEKYLGRKMQTFDETIAGGDNKLSMAEYCIEDCRATWDLYEYLEPKWIHPRQKNHYKKIEIPLIKTLIMMENTGMEVDQIGLRKLHAKLVVKVEESLADFYKEVCNHIDISTFDDIKIYKTKPKKVTPIEPVKLMGSTHKLAQLMYPNGMPIGGVIKKTPTGKIQINAEVLSNITNIHPQNTHEEFCVTISDLILTYRKYLKLKTVYVENILKYSSLDGKVHTQFIQFGCATGRLSSSKPNMLNIPKVKDKDFNIYQHFKAGEGRKLVSMDFSQIELRVIAHISEDETLKQAYIENKDIHQQTADICGCTRDEAKAVNFGINYGGGYYTLSQTLKIPQEDSKEIIRRYFLKYRKVREYQQNQIAKAHTNKCVWTACGRMIPLPQIKSPVKGIQMACERLAINAPIQGSAADIQKIALARLHDKLPEDCYIVMQVHDEITVECPENKSLEVQEIMKNVMENAVKLDVPLIAEGQIEDHWRELKYS